MNSVEREASERLSKHFKYEFIESRAEHRIDSYRCAAFCGSQKWWFATPSASGRRRRSTRLLRLSTAMRTHVNAARRTGANSSYLFNKPVLLFHLKYIPLLLLATRMRERSHPAVQPNSRLLAATMHFEVERAPLLHTSSRRLAFYTK